MCLNPCVFDSFGDQIRHSAGIWTDDALITTMGVVLIKMALAAVLEAIFVALDEPDL